MADIIAAMQSEIGRLERDLANDPRSIKLNRLRELVRIYQTERINGSEIASIFSPRIPTKRTRQPKPERELLFAEIDKFLMGKTVPIRTADVFAHLEFIGIKVPGNDPKNNLSAIIFNSGRYQSHGRQGWTLPPTRVVPTTDDPLAAFYDAADGAQSTNERLI